jgi:hypothetical protein
VGDFMDSFSGTGEEGTDDTKERKQEIGKGAIKV